MTNRGNRSHEHALPSFICKHSSCHTKLSAVDFEGLSFSQTCFEFQGTPGRPGYAGPPGSPGKRPDSSDTFAGRQCFAGFPGAAGLQGETGRQGPPGQDSAVGLDFHWIKCVLVVVYRVF